MTSTPDDSPVVLIVDDDDAVRDSLEFYLSAKGWRVETAESAIIGLEKVRGGIGEIVVSDIRMPGMDGLTFLRKLRELDSDIEVLITTGYSNEDSAIEALKAGAFDYFRKPLSGADVHASLERTRKMRELKQENRRLRALLTRFNDTRDIRFVGDSDVSRQLLRRLEKIARTPAATALLTGESGVGKEVAARMIHHLSDQQSAPFVAVNCGGMPENLLESELFGHERGAFTGAEKRTPGVFEMAEGGTVLLDEISEMPLSAQTRFLRVLEDRRFYRLGGSREVNIENVRIIAATNRNLQEMVKEGTFREDLYYRIMVAPVEIAPLRDRRGDILPLAAHFLELFRARTGRQMQLSTAAERALLGYDLPGNARDLRNMIERACIFTDHREIQPGDLGIPGITHAELPPDALAAAEAETQREEALPPPAAAASPIERRASLTLQDVERDTIAEAVRRHPGNHSAAARALGVSPQALYRKLEKYGL